MDVTEFIKVYEELSTPRTINLRTKNIPIDFSVRARITGLDFSYYDSDDEIDCNAIWVMNVEVNIPKEVREVVRFIIDVSEPEYHLSGVMEDWITYGDILNADNLLDEESSSLAKEFFGGMLNKARRLVKVFIENHDNEDFVDEVMNVTDRINNDKKYYK